MRASSLIHVHVHILMIRVTFQKKRANEISFFEYFFFVVCLHLFFIFIRVRKIRKECLWRWHTECTLIFCSGSHRIHVPIRVFIDCSLAAFNYSEFVCTFVCVSVASCSRARDVSACVCVNRCRTLRAHRVQPLMLGYNTTRLPHSAHSPFFFQVEPKWVDCKCNCHTPIRLPNRQFARAKCSARFCLLSLILFSFGKCFFFRILSSVQIWCRMNGAHSFPRDFGSVHAPLAPLILWISPPTRSHAESHLGEIRP